MTSPRKGLTAGALLLALVPLALLAAVIAYLVSGGPSRIFDVDLPPVEQIHVLRHTLEKDRIHLDIVNSGSDPTTVAQVTVREAFWHHDVRPSRHLEPLETARVSIPYPWNLGEPVGITLLTASGLTFEYEIEVASPSPVATVRSFLRFAALGLFVGVIPVALGITWFPFMRRLGKPALGFLIYLTVGLLVFLAVDAVFDGLETARELPGVYQGPALLVLGLLGAFMVLLGLESRARERIGGAPGAAAVAGLIALGIGLHNFGEGLAIGSAYVLGELTLGALLVVGFTLHNATEGIAIVSPLVQSGASIPRLVLLGLIAGGPTILGCWIGAFTYSQVWALLFLGIGAGAILQVVLTILKGRPMRDTFAPLNVAGLLTGYLVMYGTGLLVGAA